MSEKARQVERICIVNDPTKNNGLPYVSWRDNGTPDGGYVSRESYEKLQAKLELAKEALRFYADRKNWGRIEGHTKWASNLSVQDCAMLNCGGGRARLALAKLESDESEGGAE